MGRSPSLETVELQACSTFVAPWPGVVAPAPAPAPAPGPGGAAPAEGPIGAAVAAADAVVDLGGGDASGSEGQLLGPLSEGSNLLAGLAACASLRELIVHDCTPTLVRHLAAVSLPQLRSLSLERMGPALRWVGKEAREEACELREQGGERNNNRVGAGIGGDKGRLEGSKVASGKGSRRRREKGQGGARERCCRHQLGKEHLGRWGRPAIRLRTQGSKLAGCGIMLQPGARLQVMCFLHASAVARKCHASSHRDPNLTAPTISPSPPLPTARPQAARPTGRSAEPSGPDVPAHPRRAQRVGGAVTAAARGAEQAQPDCSLALRLHAPILVHHTRLQRWRPQTLNAAHLSPDCRGLQQWAGGRCGVCVPGRCGCCCGCS